ncbi:MAG TPA: DinB family protein [Terriglobales bacterium]|nr:DinB family protein [Terriglobales bacterium]
MAISAALLPEFDQEMANTRKTLERVPDSKFSWKPHEKSSAMGALAGHLANIPGWLAFTIKEDSLDLAPGGKQMEPPPTPKTNKELLAEFDKNVKDGRAVLAAASDGELMKPWSLLNNGKVTMTLPKVAVIRGFVMNHLIHHRAQLGVYLRLNNLPVPAIYGPSADEGGF